MPFQTWFASTWPNSCATRTRSSGRVSRPSSAVSQITIRFVGPIPKNSAFSARVRRLASLHLDVDLPHSLSSREPSDLGGERAVAKRLDPRGEQVRLREDEGRADRGERRAADQPPAVAEPPGEQHEQRDRDTRDGQAADPLQPRIDQDRRVVGVRHVVAAPPPLRSEHERQAGHPDRHERSQPERDSARDPSHAEPRRKPDAHHEHSEVDERREYPVHAVEPRA